MICPFCLHTKTSVYNSRSTHKINEIWRRRRCQRCKKEFTTRERTQADTIIKVQNGSKQTAFLQSKLLLSLLRSCDHRTDDEVVFYLVEAVQQKLFLIAAQHSQVITSKQIAGTVSALLQNFDPIAYVKYTAQTQSSTDLARLIKKASRSKATS